MDVFFTDKQVEEYKAGWRETHEDDDLEDDDVRSILEEEERERMIELLVRKDIESDAEGVSDLFGMILHEGFTGYRHYSDVDLRHEVKERGLESEVWGDWYEY